MNKYLLLSLYALLPFFLNAQEDSKYLEGAVPEVGGKVVFSKSIVANNFTSEGDLFDTMHKWAQENYENKKEEGLTNRLVLASKEDKDIACMGQTYLVFRRATLVLDRATMSYQLIISVEQNRCDVKIRNIKYEYSDSKTPEVAEKMITDKIALNKEKNKLNRYYDKFRRHTVDSVNSIFNRIESYLNGSTTSNAAVAPIQKAVTDVSPVAALSGFKKIDAAKIPSSVQGNRVLITSGTSANPVVIPASWGGTTTLLDKLMALCNATGQDEAMEKAQTYMISFYTELYSDAIKEFDATGGKVDDKIRASELTPVATSSGVPAFSEAWMIIECKKAGTMPAADSQPASKNYIGEILNVWVK